LMIRHQVQSIQYSMQHSVLCLFQVGLTVLGRPGDWREWVLGSREWA